MHKPSKRDTRLGIDTKGTKFNHNGKRKYPSKLVRNLTRRGSVYGRLSLTDEVFNEIRKQRA